jgi:hypothetical protein
VSWVVPDHFGLPSPNCRTSPDDEPGWVRSFDPQPILLRAFPVADICITLEMDNAMDQATPMSAIDDDAVGFIELIDENGIYE